MPIKVTMCAKVAEKCELISQKYVTFIGVPSLQLHIVEAKTRTPPISIHMRRREKAFLPESSVSRVFEKEKQQKASSSSDL